MLFVENLLKYSFEISITFGANHSAETSVGIAIIAKAPSIRFNAKSMDTTENRPTLNITTYR